MDADAKSEGPTEAEVRRRSAAAVAGHTGDAQTAHDLVSDSSASVRATALAALARLDQLTVEHISAGLSDDDAAVRRRTCALAITFYDVDLVRMLDDIDDTVVEQAAWALGERAERAGPAAVARLMRVTTEHSDALCREAAVAALGAIGDEDGLPAILKATTDKPAVRRRAVLALAPFEGPDVDAALERARGDRDWQVRQAAEDMSE